MSSFPPIQLAPEPPAEGVTPELDDQPKKKKKLTKEEKQALKKEKQLLKKQKELEDKKQQFRDFLGRELKYTDVTYQRAAAAWEAMCAAIKLKEMHEDMTELWQGLNRSLDHKTYKLQRLLRELDVAEEQYRRNFSKHADTIEYLLKLFKLFVDITGKAYEQDAADLVADFEEDIAVKNEIHHARKTYYENILHATNLITAHILNKMENRFVVDFNEVIDTHVAKRLNYRDSTIRKMEQLHSQMEKIVENLQADAMSPKREQVYNQCVERQEQAQKDMEAFRETSKRLQSTISSQQSKLLSAESDVNTQVVKLRGERSYFVEHYWQLKQTHKQSLKSHDDHMKRVAFESNKTIEKLKKIVKHGELVLGLAACCRKLQTEKEKVTPWTEDIQLLSHEAKQAEDTQDHVSDQVRAMELFWNRVAQAETHVLCLQEEKQVLERENMNFREIIKSYNESQAYNKIICSLRISPYPTSAIPVQEASLMPQLKNPVNDKKP